jgi:membrane-associated protein
MEFLRKVIDLIFGGLGSDAKWQAVIDHVGVGNLYAVLFLIVFAETGLVVTPFLPGDSLLFALGALGARGIGINLPLVTVLLIVAAVLGDAVNYWIGYKLGPAVFKREDSKLLNKKHLVKAQEFYEKYGGKTIILARFVPVVRTFAPFVAGVGRMNFFRFWTYNVIGGIAWVLICVGAGRLFGNIPFVKKNFELVIVAIVVISVLPMAIEFWNARRASKRGGSALVEATTVGEHEKSPA